MSDARPDPETAADLYERLRTGDPLAQSDFIAAVLDPLVAHLRAKWPNADDHIRITAAGDAVLSLIRNPDLYAPSKRGLIGFLRMAAEGDFRNGLAREQRHNTKRELRDLVELPDDGGNTTAEDGLPSFDDRRIAAEIAGLTPPERAVFDLMQEGEKHTPAFVAALNLGHLPEADWPREVKRVKDRIIKRLQRAGGKP